MRLLIIATYAGMVKVPSGSAVLVHEGWSLEILNNRMDKLMPEFETSNPNFFQEYFDARMIVDSGSEKKPDAKAA